MAAAGNPPKTVGDLAPFEVRVRCRNCGRVVAIDIARIRVDRHLPLTDFLARLACNETRDHRRCGARPGALEIVYTPAGNPLNPQPARRLWAMDLAGQWTEGELDVLDDLDVRQ